jgi:hypothetical protein
LKSPIEIFRAPDPVSKGGPNGPIAKPVIALSKRYLEAKSLRVFPMLAGLLGACGYLLFAPAGLCSADLVANEQIAAIMRKRQGTGCLIDV